MRFRSLSRSPRTFSEIGFGTWGLGGDAYGPVDDAQSISCIHRAMDLGVNFFDTSDLYGNGHSEEVLGLALEGRRDQAIVATKVGLLPHSGFAMPTDFSPRHIRLGIEASLRRLRVDHVDLYQLHSPELAQLRGDGAILETLSALRSEGKTRLLGVSARSPADAVAMLALFDFDFVQVNFNLIDHRASETGLFELAQARGVGVIARTPLCFGYLSGRLTGRRDFVGSDHRANWPEAQLARWAAAPGLFDRLISARGCTPAQFALLYCLHPAAVTTVIPGMMTPAEVDENTGVAHLPPLTAAEIEAVAAIYRANTFYDRAAKAG